VADATLAFTMGGNIVVGAVRSPTPQGTCLPPQVWAAIVVCTQLPDAKQAVELQWRLLLVHVSTCCWALRRQRVGPALLRCLPCL